MADEIKVEIKGLAELQRKLEEMGADAIKATRPAVRAGGKVVKNEMVLRAPKDTGIEAEHIDIKTRKQRGGDAGAVAATVGPNTKLVIHPQSKGRTAGLPRTAAFLAKLQEFGGHRQAKHPWVTQSWEVSKNKALAAIIDTLRERLRKWFQ